jgi:micrococcal nuclease
LDPLKTDSKSLPTVGIILSIFLAILLGSSSGYPVFGRDGFPDSGTVIRIADGDTVTVEFADRVERRVRLIGVDAPEMDDPREDVAFHAFLARRFAFHHLYRRDVRLTYDFSPLDEHGRVLAYIWPGEKNLFNEFIIRQGFAAAFLKYPYRKDYQKRFRAAEALARAENRGFWSQAAPEVIPVSEVRTWLGEIISVRFQCAEVSREQSFLYLRTGDASFEVLVPYSRLAAFPGIESSEGQEITVTGFLEEFKGRPQIMLSFPRQLRLT